MQSNSHKSTDQVWGLLTVFSVTSFILLSFSETYNILVLQFTVLQNGCWQKVNFGKKQAHLETSSEFRFQKKSLRSKSENPNGNYTMGTAVQGDVLCHEETKHSGNICLP